MEIRFAVAHRQIFVEFPNSNERTFRPSSIMMLVPIMVGDETLTEFRVPNDERSISPSVNFVFHNMEAR